jgi:hypothetical protein
MQVITARVSTAAFRLGLVVLAHSKGMMVSNQMSLCAGLMKKGQSRCDHRECKCWRDLQRGRESRNCQQATVLHQSHKCIIA